MEWNFDHACDSALVLCGTTHPGRLWCGHTGPRAGSDPLTWVAGCSDAMAQRHRGVFAPLGVSNQRHATAGVVPGGGFMPASVSETCSEDLDQMAGLTAGAIGNLVAATGTHSNNFGVGGQ